MLQQDGAITAIGAFARFASGQSGAPVVGDGEQVLLPGFVNAHHHIGLSPVQLGISDTTLELWFATSIAMRDRIPYYDTLYAAFEMVASGTTTAQHLHGWIPGDPRQTEAEAESIIRAYEDIGMRVSYCYALREQNHLVYEANEQFLDRVPRRCSPASRQVFRRLSDAGGGDHRAVRSSARQAQRQGARQDPAGAVEPAMVHRRGAGHARRQRRKARRSHPYASRRNALPKAIRAHGAATAAPRWTTSSASACSGRRRRSATPSGFRKAISTSWPRHTPSVCHNCSSNFRLRSGVLPLNRLEARGINTAIGLDDVGINDDQDMLQEMRMVLRAHREPGMDDRVPTMAQVFRMATSGGAQDDALRRGDRHARSRQGGRHGAHRLEADQLSLSRYRNASARRGDPASQDGGRADGDRGRRDRLSGRKVYPP